MVASDDDLIEQMSGLRGFEAFDAIEGELINDQEFGALISAQPQTMRFDCRRMKSPLASSSICSRSICGLNFQSKVSNVLGSSNRASRIRYSTDRSRRAAACWPNSRSRKDRKSVV